MIKDLILKMYIHGQDDDLRVIIGIEKNHKIELKKIMQTLDNMTDDEIKEMEKQLKEVSKLKG